MEPPYALTEVRGTLCSYFTRPPLEKEIEIMASTASIFAQILALKPPNLEFFSSQDHSFRSNISS